jgi:hypothetical protein
MGIFFMARKKVVKKEPRLVEGQHAVSDTISYTVYYTNDVRQESALFRKNRKKLITKLKTPCWICGTHEDLEAHHYHAELANTAGIDWDVMRKLHPTFDWSTFKKPVHFMDSEYNLMILCEKHHRGKNHGIHELPYPIWIMQKNKRADFIFSEDEIPEDYPILFETKT